MIVTEDGKRIALLGDPHLGRQFIHGVPLHRRGEREFLVWKDFIQRLRTDADILVCMGDLFDKWTVSYDLILKTAWAFIDATKACPNTTYVILKGNHDWTRDLERRSAFDVFAELVKDKERITVVENTATIDRLLFVSWHPTLHADEIVTPFLGLADVAFGHWDTDFSQHNLVPIQVGIPKLYTGHVHKPTSFRRHGVEVIVVGSMQPYAHGEEVNDDLYVTLDTPQGDLTNKCVRLRQLPDEPVECLQLTIQREKIDDDSDDPTVTLGDFDMDTLFRRAFEDAEVPSDITEKLLAQYHSKRVANDGA